MFAVILITDFPTAGFQKACFPYETASEAKAAYHEMIEMVVGEGVEPEFETFEHKKEDGTRYFIFWQEF